MNRIVSACCALALTVVACGGTPPEPRTATEDPPRGAPSSRAGEGAAKDDYARGMAAFEAGDWNGAQAAFEGAIRKNPKQADAHYALALVMDKTGHRAEAETHYLDALALAPDMVEPAENLTALYVEDKRYDDAIAVAKPALARGDKNAELLLNYAIALGRKGDQKAATKAFESALSLSPNDARFYLAYAQELAAWKRRDEAVARLKEAQRVAGSDAGLLGTIGFELRTLRAVPECIAAFDQAIAVKDNADFRTNRALCKLAAKDSAGARADLETAVKNEPEFSVAHYWLAWTLHEDGKFDDAVKGYESYLKLAPTGPMAKAAEQKAKLAKARKKK
jgi:Tfp pilus assembly protein PilF